jgi:hypothetical protein
MRSFLPVKMNFSRSMRQFYSDSKYQYLFKYILIIIFVNISNIIVAQNFEKIGQKDVLKVTGGVSANQMTYLTTDSNSYQKPYTWVLTGSLNINIYDWIIPLSYTISNYNKNFQQPFNQYSMHPTYKWIKAHAGYCQMSFSPYSLSGHTFLGGGVELSPPGKFHFSAMYGRLNRPIEPDSNKQIIPSYKRMGIGFKAGYQFPNQEIELSLFRGWDIRNSLKFAILDSSLKPMENVVLSMTGKTKIFGNLSLSGEVAGSCLTSDSRLPYNSRKNIYSTLGLMKNRSSTSSHEAYKAQLTYAFNKASIGIAYEHVDPNYQTLGSYYSNNDFENYTVNANASVLNNKANISVNTGLQYDNLNDTKSSKTNRYVASINLGLNLSEKLSLSTGYSNFTTYTNIRSPFEDINQPTPIYYVDSLKFTQISENINASANYNLAKNEKNQQTMSIMCNYMQSKDEHGGGENNLSHIYNIALTHSITFKPIDFNLSCMINTSYNKYPDNNSLTIGPTLSANKKFFNKTIMANASISKNYTFNNGEKQLTNFINRLSGGYTWKKRHVFSLTLVLMNRKSFISQPNSSTNLTGTLTYNYSF